MAEPVFYSLSEAAQMLGVHYETVARWVRTGKLPGVKLSRRKVVVPKDRLEAFLRGDHGSGGQNPPAIESRQQWLDLVGTLTPEEAQFLRASRQEFDKVEED